MTLGEKIKQLRSENKLTQEDLAQKLGFKRATLASWEIDRANPDPETLKQLADLFQVSIDELMGRDLAFIRRGSPELTPEGLDKIKALGQDFLHEVAKKKNPLLAKIDEITDAVKAFRQKENIDGLPVDVLKIYEKNGWILKWTDKLTEKDDGITYCHDGYYGTYLSLEYKKIPERVRFTLGHEIGHIVLNHFNNCDLSVLSAESVGAAKIAELNKEANLFSTELLMPEDFIKENIDKGIDYLKKACGVSRQAMEYRIKNLGYIVNHNGKTGK